MINNSESNFFTNLKTLYQKKIFFSFSFFVLFCLIYLFINILLQTNQSQSKSTYLTLSHNQKYSINNHYLENSIKDKLNEFKISEIMKINMPNLQIDEIMRKHSLSFSINILDFHLYSLKYPYYLDQQLHYLEDEKLKNDYSLVIKKFFAIKDLVLNVEFKSIDDEVVNIIFNIKNDKNYDKEKKIIIEYVEITNKIFITQLQKNIDVLTRSYLSEIRDQIYVNLDSLNRKYAESSLKISIYNNFAKDNPDMLYLDKIRFYYENELTKLENQKTFTKIKESKSFIDYLDNTNIKINISDNNFLIVDENKKLELDELEVNIFKFIPINLFISLFISFVISVLVTLNLNNFKSIIKED